MKQSILSINQIQELLVKKLTILGLFLLFCINQGNAATGNAVSNSAWNSTSTWLFGATHRLPNCGDTLVIPAAKTVTVNSQDDYSGCGSPMVIYVYGTLQFTNGNKIDLPCGSVVFVMSGGTVKKSTAGGGSSTLISICGTVEWKAGDGPLSGVDTLGHVVTLPIELLSFDAKANDNSVRLNWTTASEINNSYFTIEKSLNGYEYFEIGLVKGAGNSTYDNDYAFTDANPSNGVSYYRLTQTDYDGKHETFDPVAVNFRKSKADELNLIVLENPFQDILKISVTSAEKGNHEILLYDSEGSVVLRTSMDVSESRFFNVQGLNKLKPGFYFLQVNSGTNVSRMIRVVKM